MPRIPIIMPQLGESIAEATVVSIPFQVGEAIESDQDVLEVETNKATMGVTPPCGVARLRKAASSPSINTEFASLFKL